MSLTHGAGIVATGVVAVAKDVATEAASEFIAALEPKRRSQRGPSPRRGLLLDAGPP